MAPVKGQFCDAAAADDDDDVKQKREQVGMFCITNVWRQRGGAGRRLGDKHSAVFVT